MPALALKVNRWIVVFEFEVSYKFGELSYVQSSLLLDNDEALSVIKGRTFLPPDDASTKGMV